MSGIPETMRASVLLGARNLEVQQRPVPQPAADEVLIRVTSVGVCGSDVHFYEDGRLGDWLVKEPLVLGHESGARSWRAVRPSTRPGSANASRSSRCALDHLLGDHARAV